MSLASDSQTASTNPFAQQAVQDAHDDLVDVSSIYASTRTALSRGCARARLGRAHLSVVLGDVGSGKSHLLWWLRKRQLSDGLYVPIGALPDLGQPFRYTLRQLLTTLCKREAAADGSKAGDKTPLERPIDRLLWEILFRQASDLLDAARVGMYQAPGALLKLVGPLCQDGGRPKKLIEFIAAATPVWAQVEPGLRAYLLSLPTENSLDSAARAVILQYPHADRRALVTAWLAGEDLGPKDREKIGAKQSINNEAAARYVLCTLARLAGHALPGPLVLAYDHLDITGEQLGQPGLQGQAEVIAALQTQGGAVLQVVSCRPQTWTLLHEKPARPSPAQQQAPALLKNVDDLLKLERPELASLRDLVVARLAQIPTTARETLALSDQDLDPSSWPAEVGTPRAALSYYASRIQPQSAITPAVAVPALTPPAPTPVAKAPAKPTPAAAAAKATPVVKPTAVKAVVTAPPAAAKPMRKGTEDATLAVSAEMIAALQAESEDPPPPPRKPTEEATLAVPASVMAALAKEFMPDGKPLFDSKGDGEVKAASKPAPAAKPAVSAKDAPSKPGVAAKATGVSTPAKPARDADSKPGTASPAAKPAGAKDATSRRDAPSTPPTAQSDAASRALAMTPPPAKPKAVDAGLTPMAPSAQSPSVTWMAMADDNDPLAAAIAEAEAALKPVKPAAKPTPAAVKPATASSPAKRPAAVVSVNQAAVLKPTAAAAPSKPAPEPARDRDSDGDATMMAPMTAPSSQSPSVTWMAMAGGDDVLAAAIADAEADLGLSKPAAKPAKKPAATATPSPASKPAAKPAAAAPAKAPPAKASGAPSSQSPSMAWMNMGADSPLLSGSSDKLAPVTRGGRNTQEKMAPVAARPSAGLSPDQVLAALGNRSTVEEAQLAKELSVPVAALATPLARLEDRGAVRVSAMGGGKRVISKI
jgi:hypothetical protein